MIRVKTKWEEDVRGRDPFSGKKSSKKWKQRDPGLSLEYRDNSRPLRRLSRDSKFPPFQLAVKT
jgi:hypothetical protein